MVDPILNRSAHAPLELAHQPLGIPGLATGNHLYFSDIQVFFFLITIYTKDGESFVNFLKIIPSVYVGLFQFSGTKQKFTRWKDVFLESASSPAIDIWWSSL